MLRSSLPGYRSYIHTAPLGAPVTPLVFSGVRAENKRLKKQNGWEEPPIYKKIWGKSKGKLPIFALMATFYNPNYQYEPVETKQVPISEVPVAVQREIAKHPEWNTVERQRSVKDDIRYPSEEPLTADKKEVYSTPTSQAFAELSDEQLLNVTTLQDKDLDALQQIDKTLKKLESDIAQLLSKLDRKSNMFIPLVMVSLPVGTFIPEKLEIANRLELNLLPVRLAATLLFYQLIYQLNLRLLRQRKRLAYHEIGHFLVDIGLGFRPSEVKSGMSEGHVQLSGVAWYTDKETLLIFQGGFAMENLVYGYKRHYSGAFWKRIRGKGHLIIGRNDRYQSTLCSRAILNEGLSKNPVGAMRFVVNRQANTQHILVQFDRKVVDELAKRLKKEKVWDAKRILELVDEFSLGAVDTRGLSGGGVRGNQLAKF